MKIPRRFVNVLSSYIKIESNQSTGDSSQMAMEPTECLSKRGVAFDFENANDLDALALGTSWW